MAAIPSPQPNQSPRFTWRTAKDLDHLPQLAKLSAETRLGMKAVAAVWPFRINDYVIDSLIDWDNIPADPIYQLTMPQSGMLDQEDLSLMMDLVRQNSPRSQITRAAKVIQQKMNPHPAGQLQLNIPVLDSQALQGIQHKYRETLLFFPAPGQTCHSYCTYCFRWAQFVGDADLRFAAKDTQELVNYLKSQGDITDVLLTGGDPLIMKTRVLRRFIEPLLQPGLEHINHIRIGTKAPAYWPMRFSQDNDADDLLKLFESIRKRGKHLSIMAHFSHPREMETPQAEEAIKRILRTGASIRCQTPIVRYINDNASVLKRMWQAQVKCGAIPYYAFVERDTGPKHYFELPLAKAFQIFTDAYAQVSGLARTVRGPSMSTVQGKVLIDGIESINDQKVFILKFIQARSPDLTNRIFFAKFDPKATWINGLVPAFESNPSFFQASSDVSQPIAEMPTFA